MTSPRLPRVAAWLMRLLSLGERRAEVESDVAELYAARVSEHGAGYAARRLAIDIVSLLTPMPRGGNVFQDARFGLRLIRKHPAPIGITIAGLALAIAVVTATFGIINAALLRPFKMDDPSSVVSINRPESRAVLSWPFTQFLYWQGQLQLSKVEASLLDHARFSFTAAGENGTSESLQFVSGGFLPMLGGRARIGRTLEPRDDAAGAPLVAVVSHGFWTTHFNSDVSVVGRTVWIGDAAVTVVGVMDPNFTGPTTFPSAFWAPLSSYDELTHGREFTPKSNENVNVIARLAEGISINAADNELHAVSAGMLNWQGAPDRTARGAHLVSARSIWAEHDPENNYTALAALGIAALVLILACANAANLLLAGATSRMREIGVRLAMGATRGRLVRQLISESLLLGIISGALGLVMAIWLMKIGVSLASLPPEFGATPDVRVLLFAAGAAIASGIGAGLAPARYGAGGDVLTALKIQNGQRMHVARRSKLRVSFVGLQAAVSIFFLVAAGLLTRSAWHVAHTDLGFEADALLAVSLEIPRTPALYDRQTKSYNENTRAYLQSAADIVRGLPAVTGVSLSQFPPFGFSRATSRIFSHEGRSYNVFGSQSDAAYFKTAGFRIVQGRAFTDDEASSGAPVALVSESVARDFFNGTNPIGRVLTGVRTPFGHEAETTIIGVVADAMTFPINSERHGNIYSPIGSRFDNPPTLIVRAENPAKIAHAVEVALLSINSSIRPSTRIIGASARQFMNVQRSMAIIAASVAVLAFLLALLGVYGVTAFAVSQRSQEVSIRMAMGASATAILTMLVRQSLRPVVIGLATGLLAVLLTAQILASVLAGVGPRDPIAVGGGALALLGGALLAVIGPARRAARIDPARVLRG